MPILNIVTAVSRPENLLRIQENIRTSFSQIKPVWYCVLDSRISHCLAAGFRPDHLYTTPGDCSGGKQKNLAIKKIEFNERGMEGNSLIYFLDDDNLIHPSLEKSILDGFPNYGMVFNQIHKDGRIRLIADSNQVREGNIDCGQFVVSSMEAFYHSRFPEDVYNSDWHFFKSYYDMNSDLMAFVNSNCTYYNYLRP